MRGSLSLPAPVRDDALINTCVGRYHPEYGYNYQESNLSHSKFENYFIDDLRKVTINHEDADWTAQYRDDRFANWKPLIIILKQEGRFDLLESIKKGRINVLEAIR